MGLVILLVMGVDPIDSLTLYELRGKILAGGTEALFSAQVLLFLSILRNNIEDCTLALDYGADPNAPATPEIKAAVREYGYDL